LPSGSLIGLLVDINDRGASSFISDADLEVKMSGGRTLAAVRPSYLEQRKGKKVETVDSIIERFNQDPIASHSRPRGWVFFALPDVSKTEILQSGNAFTLHIWDYMGQEYTAHWTTSGGQESNSLYYPGQDFHLR
jgi:hypothetical protein